MDRFVLQSMPHIKTQANYEEAGFFFKKKAYPHLSTKTSIVSFNNSLGKYTQSFLKSLFDEKLSCYDKVRELVSQRDTSM